MYEVNGGCYCGNLVLEMRLTQRPEWLKPRACDCDFCRKHAAAYVSDPDGSLVVRIHDETKARKTRQGSGMAEFLLCGECGVLVGAFYQSGVSLYAAVNAMSLDPAVGFGVEQAVSPKRLSTAEKTRRWSEVWFSDVTVVSRSTPPPWRDEHDQGLRCS
jgi:hypothetical protein